MKKSFPRQRFKRKISNFHTTYFGTARCTKQKAIQSCQKRNSSLIYPAKQQSHSTKASIWRFFLVVHSGRRLDGFDFSSNSRTTLLRCINKAKGWLGTSLFLLLSPSRLDIFFMFLLFRVFESQRADRSMGFCVRIFEVFTRGGYTRIEKAWKRDVELLLFSFFFCLLILDGGSLIFFFFRFFSTFSDSGVFTYHQTISSSSVRPRKWGTMMKCAMLKGKGIGLLL